MEELLRESLFCDILMRKVREHFQEDENKKKFEEWYREKYGKEYDWRKTRDK